MAGVVKAFVRKRPKSFSDPGVPVRRFEHECMTASDELIWDGERPPWRRIQATGRVVMQPAAAAFKRDIQRQAAGHRNRPSVYSAGMPMSRQLLRGSSVVR
jgi:hypothetical protein